MTAGALGAAFAGVVSGAAVKYTGRIAVFTTGFISKIAFLVWMFLWREDQAYEWDLYVIAVGLGAGSNLRATQLTGTYHCGSMMNNRAGLGFSFPK